MVIRIVAVCLCVAIFLCGCRMVDIDTKKESDVDYTIASYDEVPEEVKKIIDERKEDAFSTVISDRENTYIVVGYGRKNTDGYQIKLRDIYQSTTDIFVRLEFKGPERPMEKEIVSYPFIIIKVEYTVKNINVME
ncbi:MAG: protease complex subunit PrcB family protein [Lachnospiraceae bacterium]|nr:protease complex subunit PrcB family protein [Lachnospiraceae bacterium]